MKNIWNKLGCGCALLAAGMSFSSCSLEEENPGGFTMETIASSSTDGYLSIVNNCYFAMERYFYGFPEWMYLTEGDTDLWTYQANNSKSYTQWFWFFAGALNTTYTNNTWNGTYDGIGACNQAIALAHLAPYKTEEERNAVVAEAHFMRAVYYFNAVEQFGGVTVITKPANSVELSPQRTDPFTVYQEIIIPDLEFAVQWLPVGTDATTTRPAKKAAIGFLAKAYLQTVQYDATKQYASKALEYAKMLIDDVQKGGADYNAYMYPTFEEVFAEDNNFNNKEALWKHRYYVGAEGHGSSNGNYKTNRNDEIFGCKLSKFGARVDDQDTRLSWEGCVEGQFMPTQHLLNLFVEADGSLDPRFIQSFQLAWNANTNFNWTEENKKTYDRSAAVADGTQLNKGNLAIRFVMPQEDDYAQVVANKFDQPYLVVDYKDVYDDQNKNVKMTYTYANASLGTVNENPWAYFYPSLTKHNSSNYYVVNAGKKRNGNLNATFMMRMAEMYLIAAEADIYVNGGANAMGYINTVRSRAGAKPLAGTADLRTVLDERARELCGEYCRFYDLKRTGYLTKEYLQSTHPDLAQYFKPEYALRPISTTYTATLQNGSSYQNPGY